MAHPGPARYAEPSYGRKPGRSRARSRAAELADRYALALEQLGCDELDVRIGGIRALERVARDSPETTPP